MTMVTGGPPAGSTNAPHAAASPAPSVVPSDPQAEDMSRSEPRSADRVFILRFISHHDNYRSGILATQVHEIRRAYDDRSSGGSSPQRIAATLSPIEGACLKPCPDSPPTKYTPFAPGTGPI